MRGGWNRAGALRIDRQMPEREGFSKLRRALLAAIVAMVCIGGLVVIVHTSLKRPHPQPPQAARSATTGVAAREAGAKVLPTDPDPAIKPTPAAPPPVQPANPN